MLSAGLPTNNIAAIGAPLARLFWLAQKTAQIWSPRVKPRFCAANRTAIVAIANKTATPIPIRIISNADVARQTCAILALQNAAKTIEIITARSINRMILLCFSIKLRKIGRKICPKAKGNNKVLPIAKTAGISGIFGRSLEVTTIETNNGVINIPIMFEIVALKTAAGTLPLAIAVKATDDDIVEGKAQRKKKPSLISSLIKPALNT